MSHLIAQRWFFDQKSAVVAVTEASPTNQITIAIITLLWLVPNIDEKTRKCQFLIRSKVIYNNYADNYSWFSLK